MSRSLRHCTYCTVLHQKGRRAVSGVQTRDKWTLSVLFLTIHFGDALTVLAHPVHKCTA
uniref:Uncharacterized protein n=1 Tax=Anguilla anguilla TaxID=7936 RepID=A0A0E9S9H0_ANGAN